MKLKTTSIEDIVRLYNLKTNLVDLNLPKSTDEIVNLLFANNKSEIEICVWFQSSNSWLNGTPPWQYCVSNGYGYIDYLLFVANQYILPVMHG